MQCETKKRQMRWFRSCGTLCQASRCRFCKAVEIRLRRFSREISESLVRRNVSFLVDMNEVACALRDKRYD